MTLIVTTNEDEAEDWKAQLKKTIVQERVLDEDEVDWRAGLKVNSSVIVSLAFFTLVMGVDCSGSAVN